MNQTLQLIQMFHENNNQLTLGQIMKTDLAAEYRKHISLLRKDPYYNVPSPVLDRANPSNNLYTLIEVDKYSDSENLISECEKVKNTYPYESQEKKKIDIQISQLKDQR